MPNKPLNALIRHMRVSTQPPASQELSDSELLDRFVQRCDQAAFELLVWRHGTMVFNHCLRVLHREHDAEDAFQATFLALARKARAIGKKKSVGSWLYKVAHRVALRSRSTLNLQSLPDEPQVDKDAGDVVANVIGRELSAVIDEELRRLSEKYRTAFVLCQMEGQTIEAAAQILGCPSGTIGTRLARARSLLCRRLTRRGIDIPVAFSARIHFAGVPVSLVASTVKAALSGTTHQAVTGGLISAYVANLTNGVLRTMIVKKCVQTCAVIFGLSLLGGVVVQALESQAIEPGQPPPFSSPNQSVNKNAGVLLEWKFALNRPIHQEVTIEFDQIIKIQDQKVKQRQTQDFYLVWTPVEHLGDNWRLRLTIQGLKMEMDTGGNKVSFDSSQDQDKPGSLFEFYRALIGTPITVTLNKENKVQKIEGRDEFLKNYNSLNSSVPVFMKTVLSDDAIQQLVETSFGGLPRGTIQPGEDWSLISKFGLIPVEDCPLTSRFTYAGLEGKLDKITIRVEGNPKEKHLLRTKDGNARIELQRLEGTGMHLFDRMKGRSVSSERNLMFEGKYIQMVGGKESERDISQTQKTTIKTTEVAPLHWSGVQIDPKDKEIKRLREENELLRTQLRAIEEVFRKKPE